MPIPKLKSDLEIDSHWNDHPSFEELARQQGVRPAERFEDYAGGWPEDEIDDGFEEALERFRQTGSWDEA